MHLGETLPLWSALPFAGILLSIALFPLLRPRFWHHHYPKVALFWGVVLALPFLIAYRGAARHALLHVFLADYVPFVILLWALYTVAGGIVLRGTLRGTPGVNTLLLGIGTLLASWIGTTGASMLLIRPLLRANAARATRKHLVVFFIFLVSNIGGSLTPLGDPPLFLGFLRGVPFFWTMHLLLETLTLAVLAPARSSTCWTRDTTGAKCRPLPDRGGRPRTAAHRGRRESPLVARHRRGGVRLRCVCDSASVTILGRRTHQAELAARRGPLGAWDCCRCARRRARCAAKTNFVWAPMREVAILFAAIFATIVPALAILRSGRAGRMAALVRAVERTMAVLLDDRCAVVVPRQRADLSRPSSVRRSDDSVPA